MHPLDTVAGLAASVKGFLEEGEARRLYHLALEASARGPCLEIGSYCGKSTLYIGCACRQNGSVLFSIDHHRGSEEQQPGEEFFDPDLLDPATGLVDTFPHFRRVLSAAGLEQTVAAMVCDSEVAARQWATPLALVFIDGGHTFRAARTDYACWAPHLVPGGILAIHDVFEDPSQGGQAPRAIRDMARASGLFDELEPTRTLAVLRRKSGIQPDAPPGDEQGAFHAGQV
ncbi:MAG: class I SAM-dependent methyltransferase [Deltaproteobacteria bacterium]|nr:class I SAM-dependent methyltransferase [Deltaproteobacteria bacterium]